MCAKQWNEEIKIDGVTYPADQLNRKQDAELLTKILVRRSNSNREKPNKSSYVINVNAEWGAGKTYFVKRWAEDLKHEHPVVYIDAWSNDFMDSPIITVLAEIQEQLLETINKSHLTQAKRKSFKNIGISVLPKILAALVKRYGGFDIEDIFVDESSDTEVTASTENNKSLDLSAAMEAMTTQAFKEHSDYKKGVKELKATIKELVKYSIEKPKNGLRATARDYPAFIFIDELDRCRPTYAVEMLEAIKHIFDIEGLVIVVSTHTEELQHTIKALYGSDFNANDYLKRFFDTKYHLDVSVSASLIKANCDISMLKDGGVSSRGVILFPYVFTANNELKENILLLIASIASWQELSPRTAIQFAERLLISIELVESNKTIDIVLLSVLLCLYVTSNPEYDYVIGQLELDNPNFNIQTTNSKLRLAGQNFNLENSLESLITNNEKISRFEQQFNLSEYETNIFKSKRASYKDFNFLLYIKVIKRVLNRKEINNTGYLTNFGYKGQRTIDNNQLLEAYMTYYGLNKSSITYYLLLELNKLNQ
ncbi:P-loop NTPase fold protein [Pseudoalteromonas sp. APC 3250]|uniref:P-loop NTPase fold protein n=1 Tax=Pseudoalteromonas sp. APC 3250 TaxID=3035184 RepID=UPI0025B2EACE|nr:P-loop NTPase fold protein [Pseudoalteromonas sp. APC 3250]MDN3414367.1 P-loop NTPase fold protein [Pseudoalteromonas sp. APC 3250]